MGDKSPIEHLCQFAFTKQLVLIRQTKVLLAVLIQRNILKVILQTLHCGMDFQKERLRGRRFFVPHSNKNQ